jgi:hypothetical protein
VDRLTPPQGKKKVTQWRYLQAQNQLTADEAERKGKVVLVLTWHHAMKTHWREWRLTPHIFNLVPIRRWVVSFGPRLPYPNKRVPGTLCVGESNSQSGRCGEEKKSPAGNRTLIPRPYSPKTSRYTDWAILTPEVTGECREGCDEDRVFCTNGKWNTLNTEKTETQHSLDNVNRKNVIEKAQMGWWY